MALGRLTRFEQIAVRARDHVTCGNAETGGQVLYLGLAGRVVVIAVEHGLEFQEITQSEHFVQMDPHVVVQEDFAMLFDDDLHATGTSR